MAAKRAQIHVTLQIKPPYPATTLLIRIIFFQPFKYKDPWCLHLVSAYKKVSFQHNILIPLNSLNPGFWFATYSKMKCMKYTSFTPLLLILPIILINWPRNLKVHTAVFTFAWFHNIFREFSYKPSFQFNSQLNGKKNKEDSVVIHAWDFCLKRKCRPKKKTWHMTFFFFKEEHELNRYEDLAI